MSTKAFEIDTGKFCKDSGSGVQPVITEVEVPGPCCGVDPVSTEHSASGPVEGFSDSSRSLLSAEPLPAEADFYRRYSWCLNAFPTFHEVANYLAHELENVDVAQENWTKSEVITNMFLFCCSIADTVDDYLLGNVYDFSKVERLAPVARPAIRTVSRLLDLKSGLRSSRLAPLRAWRACWGSALVDFIEHCLVEERAELETLKLYRGCLSRLLKRAPIPKATNAKRIKIPAFFRSRDFAPADCFELSRKFAAAFPEDSRATLVVGLRTAGSFLAALSCAFLRKHRNGKVDWITIRPGKGLARHEQLRLRSAAKENARVLVADESIHSGHTLAKTVELLRRTGFTDSDVVVLNPAEPAFPNWKTSRIRLALPNINILTLEPAERYKQRLLDSEEVSSHLKDYFAARGYRVTKIGSGVTSRDHGPEWCTRAPERVDIRLKRIYEVRLQRLDGRDETRYVLAKSVGWGWLSYHAFLSADRLRGFVPPLLGLRDGILYMEWIPQDGGSSPQKLRRESLADRIAEYVATRAQTLKLKCDPNPDLIRELRHKGVSIIADSLRRAHKSRVASLFSRGRIQKQLVTQGATPVLTDSRMSLDEWIVSGSELLKTDFEHHGQGKNELGITDPAYDLAGAIFHFQLSEQEADLLISRYVAHTGDGGVLNRLYFNKLLVGLWEQNLATLGLHASSLVHRRQESHQLYTRAWNFLVGESIRECGKLCSLPSTITWKMPLVVTDIDGVVDRMVFGFPSTTASGIEAISLLHAHGFTIAANTARSLDEVKQYCRSYGFAGGLAEYGAVIWDQVNQREIGLLGAQSLTQLAAVRDALREIPGVFLNEDYRYSLRAFTYQDDRTCPLPRNLAQDLLARAGAGQLQVHQTGLDTAIVAKEADKGTGLQALLKIIGISAEKAIAIGDSDPDLAMFRVAGSSYAPGHIVCQREARLLGCHIAGKPYQPGLLQIARKIVHHDGRDCEQCRSIAAGWEGKKNLFVSLLRAADEPRLLSMLRGLSRPALLAAFQK